MKLIDADALKEDFKTRLADCNDWIENAKDKETKIRASAVKTFICEVIMTIDNAPTIKDRSLEIAQKSIELGRKVGQLEGKLERPQGEWIDRNGNTLYPFWVSFECNQCHKFSSNYNFCPNCGAKMKGGAE